MTRNENNSNVEAFYSTIENIKNGWVDSTFYGRFKRLRFKSPHIIVFTNNVSNMSTLSSDRFNLFALANKDHGLPVDNNGKTPKTELNAIALADSIIDMPNRENIVWYTDGPYQGGTASGCDCVNLFDPDPNVIAVYQKQPDGSNLFLTTCALTDRESDHLKSTNGNFVTEEILDQQNWVSEGIGITPIDNSQSNNP